MIENPRDTVKTGQCPRKNEKGECPRKDQERTTSYVEVDGKLHRIALCSSCAEYFENWGEKNSNKKELVGSIFGATYGNKTFKNFVTDPLFYEAYNAYLKSNFPDVFDAEHYVDEAIEDVQNAYHEALRFVNILKKKGYGRLLIHGGVGSGKTHLMAAICHEAISQGKTTGGIDAIEFLGRITDTYSSGFSKEKQTKETIINNVAESDVVFLDNLTGLSCTDSTKRHLIWLFERIIKNNKSLVVGSGMFYKEIQDQLGREIADRLLDPPSVEISIDSPSFRGVKRRILKHENKFKQEKKNLRSGS